MDLNGTASVRKFPLSALLRNPGIGAAFVALASLDCGGGTIGAPAGGGDVASGFSSAGPGEGGAAGGSSGNAGSGGSSSGSGGASSDADSGGASVPTTSSGSSDASGSGALADGAAVDAASEAAATIADAGGCVSGVDTLKTGNARTDAYDCLLLGLGTQYGHPDPMMVKAQVQQESAFSILATSPDSPCGSPPGWSDAESKSFGLVQVTPACGEEKPALLPNGHPNLDKDMQSTLWATSVFNPSLNLEEGFKTITGSLQSLKAKYPGCTSAQYVAMSAGAFNSGDSSVSGCGMYNARAQSYVNAVLGHYRTFAASAGWPDPY